MKKVLVIAPHPDDETLGCGGALLRHVAEGASVQWLIATKMTNETGFTSERIARRNKEIEAVSGAYGFSNVIRLGFPTTTLDSVPRGNVISALAAALGEATPEIVYLPFAGDAHSDHGVVFAASIAAMKWFRKPSVKRILSYETLSETDAAPDPSRCPFNPTSFIDIGAYIERKIEIARLYGEEMGTFPFPRSEQAIRAQAQVRGATAGFSAAEAFALVRERI